MSGDGALGARGHREDPRSELWSEACEDVLEYFGATFGDEHEHSEEKEWARTLVLVAIARQLERIGDILEARWQPE